MYMRNKLFVLFCGFLWAFGFITGLIIRDMSTSSVSCDSLLNRNTRVHIETQLHDGNKAWVDNYQIDKVNEDNKQSSQDNIQAENEPATTSSPSVITTSTITTSDNPLPHYTIDTQNNCLIFQNRTLSTDKFSIIIPTYKRVKLLKQVLKNYCDLQSHVDTIIVVWNNIKESIPKDIKEFSCQVKLILKTPSVNSLNNRFIHYPEIKTQAVLSADDDLLILHKDLIYQFETWKQFKHLIVGFAPRKHIPESEKSKVFVYGGPPQDGNKDRRYSFILTTSAMFHTQYLHLYQSKLPKHFRQFVDQKMNCEDIFLNAIVADHLNKTMGGKQCPALLVPFKTIKMIENQNKGYKGLWSRPKHKKVRNECLNLVSRQFNGFPFDYSTLKITSA